MTGFQLTATLWFESSFHIGTGLSGSGADRTVRSHEENFSDDEEEDDPPRNDSKTKRRTIPEISGEAVKGSIRGSAERIVRWLIQPKDPIEKQFFEKKLLEEEDNSLPRHPALQRIFAWQSLNGRDGNPPASYRFSTPRYLEGGRLFATATTAINAESGVAEKNTLRVMQHWSANAYFAVTIDGRGGDWANVASQDYLDLVLLVAAFVATAQVGGKKGNGLGETTAGSLYLSPMAKPELDAATLARLRTSLIEELRKHA